MSREAIVAAIGEVFPLEPIERGHAPAQRFRYLDRVAGEPGGCVGVIPSVTEPFCSSCDRVRLGADGSLRNCLFALDDFDLRSALRSSATDDEIVAIIGACVQAKWAGHAIDQVHFIRPAKSMSQLGG